MKHTAFIEKVIKFAKKSCGTGFLPEINKIFKENEKALKATWQRILPANLTLGDQKRFSETSKFEIILSIANTYVRDEEYVILQLQIARLCIDHIRFDMAVEILNHIIQGTNNKLVGTAHGYLGEILAKQSNWDQALEEFEKATKMLQISHSTYELAHVYNTVGIINAELGKLSFALDYFNKASRIATANTYKDLLLKILMNTGNIQNIHSSWNDAILSYQSALKILGRKKNDTMKALIHHNMSIAYKNKGRLDIASQELKDSLKLSERSGDIRISGISYLESAEISTLKDEIDESIILVTKAFKVFTDMKDRLGMAEVYKIMGMNYKKRGNFSLAEVYLGNSLRINERYDNKLNTGETHLELARLKKETNNPDIARDHYAQAIKCFTSLEATKKLSLIAQEMSGKVNI